MTGDRTIREYRIHVNGEWIDSTSGRTIEVINPATEQVVARVADGTTADARQAISAARTAFDHGDWPRADVGQRRRVLARMVEILDRRRDELVDLSITTGGAARSVAETVQVDAALAQLRDMVQRIMPRFEWEVPSPAHIGQGIGQGTMLREPYGVAALISAYNFPLMLELVKLAPALAAGCTTILKPAVPTPIEALVLAEVAAEAGLPPGVLNVVTGDKDVSLELSVNPGVDLLSFTGSDTVGKLINAQAAPSLKKVVLELGGKSPHIVTEDADLAKAAAEVARQTVLHAGQGCALLTRTIVHRSRHDELVELVADLLARVTVGDPADPNVDMGPLISAQQRAKVEALIETGVAAGATLACGGGRPAGLDRGFFVQPTLFANVDNSMRIARQEFFGPVNVVIPFDTDDEAVAIANDSAFGLQAAVRAADPVRAYAIARRIRAGTVVVNGGGGAFPNPYMPFGGYKDSGLGRERGAAGLEEYLQTKAVVWGVAAG
jgi:aldehyde dehydrogenase (NAD+)